MKRVLLLIMELSLLFALGGCGDNDKVESVSLSKSSISLITTENAEIEVTVQPNNLKNISLKWTSSDDAIATVAGDGKAESGTGTAVIAPISAGNVEITVTTENGCSATCTVFVREPVEVSSITVSPSVQTLITGETKKLSADIKPSNADNKDVSWASSNPNVVSVDDSGNISAIAVGNVEITVKAANGVSASSSITVRAPIEVADITLAATASIIPTGMTTQITPSITPANADDKSITWTSSDTTVATVNASGLVSGISAGDAIISATATNGVCQTYKITVRAPIEVESVELSESEIELIIDGVTKLTATIYPDNADNKSLTWSSSNQAVVNITGGVITGKAEGTAIVSVATANGKVAECTVTVSKLNTKLLDKLLKEQPMYVESTKYVVQSTRWKALYPDMLQAVIKNKSGTNVKNAIVAFVAWDSNGLPVKIYSDGVDLYGAYVRRVNYGDVNMKDGSSFGSGSGFEIDCDKSDISKFKAIVVEYTDFDGNTWKNPYYDAWKEMYENKVLPE